MYSCFLTGLYQSIFVCLVNMTPHLPHTKWYCKIFILLIYIYIYIYIKEIIKKRTKRIFHKCIDANYRIYVSRLRNGGKLALKGLSIRFLPSHINSLFSVNTLIMYLSCNKICKTILFNLIIKKI